MAQINLWTRNTPVLQGELLAIDTETELIKDHTIPPVVTLQICNGSAVHVVHWGDIPEYVDRLSRQTRGVKYAFHNAAFDIAVLGYPEFLLNAVEHDEVTDTMLRYSLFRIEQDGFMTQRSLQHVCKEILGLDIAKDDDVRLTFSRSAMPSSEQLKYAALDPMYTYLLATTLRPQKTEGIQVRGAIALDDISRRGLLVDEERRGAMETRLTKEVDECLVVLADNGYVPKEKDNTQYLQGYLERLERRLSVRFPRTEKTDKIQTSEEALTQISDEVSSDPFLTSYKRYMHLSKMIQTYLKTSVIGSDGRVHTRFNPLVVSGRTSSSEPNLQNLPREEGFRGIYIPPPGSVFSAIDYCQLELCALAQHLEITLGKSVMADILRSGIDIHKFLASKMYNCTIDDVTKTQRQRAKVASFGFPGGLSANTFIDYARQFGMKATYEEAYALREAWLEAFPEMHRHLQPECDPESPGKFIGRTLTGRIRGKCSYTESCNSVFQSLAADGAKEALWLLFRPRIPVVNFIHDETINEVKIGPPKDMSDRVHYIEELMIAGMEKVIPDIPIKTESTLMDRWYKEAKPVFDAEGNLVLWKPEPQES